MNYKNGKPVVEARPVPPETGLDIDEMIALDAEREATKIIAAESQIKMSEEISQIKEDLNKSSKKSSKMNWTIIILTGISVLIGIASLLITIFR